MLKIKVVNNTTVNWQNHEPKKNRSKCSYPAINFSMLTFTKNTKETTTTTTKKLLIGFNKLGEIFRKGDVLYSVTTWIQNIYMYTKLYYIFYFIITSFQEEGRGGDSLSTSCMTGNTQSIFIKRIDALLKWFTYAMKTYTNGQQYSCWLSFFGANYWSCSFYFGC